MLCNFASLPSLDMLSSAVHALLLRTSQGVPDEQHCGRQLPSLRMIPGDPQGAQIGENVVVDSLDVTDYDLISIGDNVAVGEGATIMGHFYKDGYLQFDEVTCWAQAAVASMSLCNLKPVCTDGCHCTLCMHLVCCPYHPDCFCTGQHCTWGQWAIGKTTAHA